MYDNKHTCMNFKYFLHLFVHTHQQYLKQMSMFFSLKSKNNYTVLPLWWAMKKSFNIDVGQIG